MQANVNFTKKWTSLGSFCNDFAKIWLILVIFYHFLKFNNMVGTKKSQAKLSKRRSHWQWANSIKTLTKNEYSRFKKEGSFLRLLYFEFFILITFYIQMSFSQFFTTFSEFLSPIRTSILRKVIICTLTKASYAYFLIKKIFKTIY